MTTDEINTEIEQGKGQLMEKISQIIAPLCDPNDAPTQENYWIVAQMLAEGVTSALQRSFKNDSSGYGILKPKP